MVGSQDRYHKIPMDKVDSQSLASSCKLKLNVACFAGSCLVLTLGFVLVTSVFSATHHTSSAFESIADWTSLLGWGNLKNGLAMVHFLQVARRPSQLPQNWVVGISCEKLQALHKLSQEAELSHEAQPTTGNTQLAYDIWQAAASAQGTWHDGLGMMIPEQYSDGQYWLHLDCSTNETEDRPADVEVSTFDKWRRNLVVRGSGADSAVSINVIGLENAMPVLSQAGGIMWPGSVAGASWMARLIGPTLRGGGDVLELGSGVGVFGIAAGAAAAAIARKDGVQFSLTLSDHSDVLVSNLRDSIAENAPLLDGLTSANARLLDWEGAMSPGFVPHARYDYVLASDCVYDLKHVEMLIVTIIRHLKEGGSAFLISQTNRQGWNETVEALSKRGKIARFPVALAHKTYDYWKMPTITSMELAIFQKQNVG